MRTNRAVLGMAMIVCLSASLCGPGTTGTPDFRPDAPVIFPDPARGLDDTPDVREARATGDDSGDEPRDDSRPTGDAAGDWSGDQHDIATPEPGDVSDHDLADPGREPGTPDAGCHADVDCPEGFWCDEPTCRACDTADHCGPKCLKCGPGLECWLGKCVECVAGADCGPGRWCDGGTCVPCANDNPAHCGADCEPCTGEYPACVAGECRCTEVSCGSWRRCVEGDCRACDTVDACGPDCTPCETLVPYCQSATVGCVQCLDAGHCGEDETCLGWACVSVCAQVQGCATDGGSDGKKCSTAKVIGRSAALAGYIHNGDTTNDGNNDDLSFPLFQDKVECWDANEDNFFRVYLLAGERLDLTLTPKDPLFDSMLKIYRGTGCKAGGDPYHCINNGGDGKPDSIKEWTAPADGWVTIVVDGRRAFEEDGDWGPYSLEVRLTCLRPDCCCPAP